MDQVQIPDLDVPNVGATFMGAALELLAQQVQQNVQKSSNEVKGDWRPLLFLMTDGSPSDVYAYQQIVPTIKQLNFATIVNIAAGPKRKPNPCCN